ncbi:MAG: HepT-like ribonuclease domain-containing protein [Candidatus Korobacteraceae bacterium]
MPFRDNSTHLRDILEAINHVESFLSDMDFDAYNADPRTKSAVERQTQIITEAAVRLGEEAETLVPGPDWKGFRGMGNILRHAYDRIDDS